MKFELSVADHSELLELLWDCHRAQARDAVTLFRAAEFLPEQDQQSLRAQAADLAAASALTRRIWACLAEQ